MPAPSHTYFAAESDPKKFGGLLVSKVTENGSWSDSSDIYERLERAYRYYFGLSINGEHGTSAVRRGGEQGELAEVRVNHSRSLAQTMFNLVAAGKVAYQPVATNSDYSSASQAVLAQSLLEYYWADGMVSQYCQRGLEESIPFTESFLLTEWDETMGEAVAVDETGGIVKTGDIRFTNVMSWDTIRDPRKSSYEELDWVILRIRRNRFNVAARFTSPEMMPDATPEERQAVYDRVCRLTNDTVQSPNSRRLYETIATESDDIDVFHFFHKTSAALPQGRETVFLSSDLILKDGPLSYNFWPVHRCFHSELHGTPFAYSPYLEILGLQEEVDSLETSICSNQTAFGTQNIIMEQGTEIDPALLSGGMRVLYVPPGGMANAPRALQLTATPQEIFAHVEAKKKDMEQLMGLNSVVRGEPMTGDQSGSALALLQAQAVQQSSSLQANYLRFVQSVGNAILELIRTRCPLPRRIAISGKANQFLQKEQTFTGESIGQIRKVLVEIGNPMAQTAAGRVSMAKELLQNQLIKTPEQYLQVITTGRIEPLTQSIQNELLLILKENEQILGGTQPIASVDDDHMLHAREHRGVVANPDARLDPQIMAAYMAHIQEHEQLYFTADPRRLALMGQAPPPMMPPGMPPIGAPPGTPPSGPPDGAPPGLPSGAPPPPPGQQPSSAGPQMPAMPVDPSTGSQFAPADGATLGRTGQAPPGPKGPVSK